VTCTLSVTSNEPVTDGADWIVVDAHDVVLRAERDGDGSGRIYTINIACENLGTFGFGTLQVTVPHDQGH
jgi:hypothetical protein